MTVQVEAGADKAMGGEVLMAAVRDILPDVYAELVRNVPGEIELDAQAGATESVNVTR
jgi:hypothetical protein